MVKYRDNNLSTDRQKKTNERPKNIMPPTFQSGHNNVILPSKRRFLEQNSVYCFPHITLPMTSASEHQQGRQFCYFPGTDNSSQ